MITPEEIKGKAEKKYRGFLSSLISEENIFPLEIPFGKVKSSETLSNFSRLSKQLERLKQNGFPLNQNGYYIDYKERNDRQIGKQLFPVRIYFPSPSSYIHYLGCGKDVADFTKDAEKITTSFPILKNWIIKNPHLVVQHNGHWESLLKVCSYFDTNRQPSIYIRELPIEVDTKFIESYKPILQKLLDLILGDRINEDVSHFESRYGLKYNEPLVRMRILDKELAQKTFNGIDDLSIPVSQFNSLSVMCSRVFILENINNYLTLPHIIDSMAIFGSGFRVGLLKEAKWLNHRQIHYWGDIDTHGFQILSQVRGYYNQTKSFLMDRKTFETFEAYHVDGADTTVEKLENLTEEEHSLYHDLLLLKKKNRLEQEKIPHKYVVETLNGILD